MFYTGTGSLDVAFTYLATYILGSNYAVGLYLLTLLLVGFVMVRVEFTVVLILLLPLNVVLMANGAIYPVAAGIHALIVFIVMGLSFMRDSS